MRLQIFSSKCANTLIIVRSNVFRVNMSKAKRPRTAERPTNPKYFPAKEEKEPNDELKSLMKAGEEIKERIDKIEANLNPSVPNLQLELQNLRENVETLLGDYNLLSTKVREARTEIEELKKKNEELNSKLRRLESAMENLELGQMMTVFERNVSKFVLQPDIKVGNYGGLRYMIDVFDTENRNGSGKGKNKKKIDESKQERSESRWKEFQSYNNIEWTEEHWHAISEIKGIRNRDAHPETIHYSRVKQQITEDYVHWETQLRDIIKMSRKLNCLLVLGQFAYGFQEAISTVVCLERKKMKITELISMLKSSKSNEKGKAECARWDELVQGKKWTTNHEKTLERLMDLKRDECILQNIDFDDAKKEVVDYIPKELKSECFDIIDIMKNIPPETWINNKVVGKNFYKSTKQ